MSREDRDKWNQRYAEDSQRKHNPVDLIDQWAQSPGRALDIASGAGRNSIALAQRGYRVDALDISSEGLRQTSDTAAQLGLEINCIEHDLDQPYPFAREYDLILVMWYVNLPLITRLCDFLAPAGRLISQQHLLCDGDLAGPGNPRFRVKPGALAEAVASLNILYYRESMHDNDAGEAMASAAVVATRE